MAIKYQVFVSSTYEDLKAERDQVIKAILEMGHIPVGMEMFSAADEEQWKMITRQIDQTDYYVVIVAHRYGSVIESTSYTEKEYDYAVHEGVPVLGFVIDNSAPWPGDRVDTDGDKKEALDRFKDKLRRKPIGFWTSAEDLYGKFSIALMKLINTSPRPGWARATELVGPEVMKELTRLSSENAGLRTELERALNKVEEDTLAKREKTIRTLRKNNITVRLWLKGAASWGRPTEIALFRLFSILAPELLIERSTSDAALLVGTILNGSNKPGVRTEWPIASNTIKVWLSDLMTLGLIMPSPRKHPVSDKNEYWTLTNEGREVLALLRKSILEQGDATEVEVSEVESEQNN